MKMVNKKTLFPALLLLGGAYLSAQDADIPTVDLGNLGANTFGTEATVDETTTPAVIEEATEPDLTSSLETTVMDTTIYHGDLLLATDYQPLTEYSQFWEVMGLPETYTLETHAQPITDFQETFGLPPSPSYNVNKEDSPLTIPLINHLYKMLTAYNADELLLVTEDNSTDTLFNTRLGEIANKLFNIDRRDQNDLSEAPNAISRHGLYIAAISQLLSDPNEFRDEIEKYATIIKDESQIPESTYEIVEAISYTGDVVPYWTPELRTAVKDLFHEVAANEYNMPRTVYDAIVNSEYMSYSDIVDEVQDWMEENDLVFAKISSRDYGFIPRDQAEAISPESLSRVEDLPQGSLDAVVGNQTFANPLVQYITGLSALDQNEILEDYMGIPDDATPLQKSSAIAQFQSEMGLLDQSGRISGNNRLQLLQYAADQDPELLRDIVQTYQRQ